MTHSSIQHGAVLADEESSPWRFPNLARLFPGNVSHSHPSGPPPKRALFSRIAYRMSQLAIVNAPSSFTAIWAVMRPWLAKETVAKVSVLGSNYAPALLELIEAESLPTSLGGKCTCAECTWVKVANEDIKDGVGEMGRCAYSSAGPWMANRDERRASYLRGERGIALLPGELEAYEEAKAHEKDVEVEEKTPRLPAAQTEKEPVAVPASVRERGDSEGVTSDGEDSSDDSSPGPGTPGLDPVQQQLEKVSINEDWQSVQSKDAAREGATSVNLVAEKHPETETVQPASDLYAEA